MNMIDADERIRREVQNGLRRVLLDEGTDLKVVVREGVVTLSGTVANPDLRRYAERLARSVRGVNEFADRIEIRRARSDSVDDVRLTRAAVDTFDSGHHPLF